MPQNDYSRRFIRSMGTLSLIALIAVPASTQQQQQVLPPIARYTIDAGTMSGMAGLAGGGMGAALSMMGGGAGRANHEMILRIGSTRTPTGAPVAEHFMPAGAKLGRSVALTYTPGKGAPDAPEGQTPKGRLLIYWGCGATAPKGQPIVIDFAKVAKGQVPPGLYQQAINLPGDWDIRPTNSKTYADWPNAKDNKSVRPDSSLIGAHRITSSYAPEIAFTLNQDFMPPLSARSAEQAGGAIALSWNRLPTATGYYAWAFSARDQGGRGQPTEMVWWASSATQAFGGPLWDWLSPAAVQKLIGAKTVMPPTQTSCQIPAEVRKAGGEMMMGSLYAYGPEQHFANPPRPADPKIAWTPDWTTRVRFRSNTMFMVGGPDMGDMSGRGDEAEEAGAREQPGSKPKCKGLGGAIMRARGLCE
jgi:hypothetical protein